MNHYLAEYLGESYKEAHIDSSHEGYSCRAVLVGERVAPVVTIVPGFSSEIEQMAPFIKKFRLSGYSVVCLSQPGAPTSAQPNHFYKHQGFSGFAASVKKALARFGIPKTFIYASSTGAAAAASLASEEASLVQSIVAMNPAALFSQSPFSAAYGSIFTLFVDWRRHAGVVKDAPRPPKPKVNFLVSTYRHYWGFWNLSKIAAQDSTFENLKKVSAPVLILVGEKDTLAQFGKIKERVENFKNVQVYSMAGFSHSDPNSEEKIEETIEKAACWFEKSEPAYR